MRKFKCRLSGCVITVSEEEAHLFGKSHQYEAVVDVVVPEPVIESVSVEQKPVKAAPRRRPPAKKKN